MWTNLLLAGALLCVALPASAQDRPAVEVSGGYSLLTDSDLDANFHGWLASVTGNVNPWFGIVGEVGGNYKSLSFEGIGVDLSLHSFLTGPRFAMRGPVTPWVQVLVGGVRASASGFGESESDTEFALQPGGGVDIWLQRAFGFRVGADYRRILADDEGLNQFRFHVGVVAGIGSR